MEHDFYYVQHFLHSPAENGVSSFCPHTANTSHMEGQNTSSGIHLPLNGSRDGWALQSEERALADCSSHEHHACALPWAKNSSRKRRVQSHGPWSLGGLMWWDYHPAIFLASYLTDGKRQDNCHWILRYCLETVGFWDPHWSHYWANTDWCLIVIEAIGFVKRQKSELLLKTNKQTSTVPNVTIFHESPLFLIAL